ncbi:MAG: hypothetical protein JJD97_08545, partial [Gemmatimonadaceae bacterium]|nr:hypothetical protein [Gemmatimonadaceae bacterium]
MIGLQSALGYVPAVQQGRRRLVKIDRWVRDRFEKAHLGAPGRVLLIPALLAAAIA